MTADSQPRTAATTYDEQLTVPPWWYLLGGVVALLLGLEVGVVLPYWWGLVPILGCPALTVFIIRRMSSGRVSLRDGRLTAGDSTLDVSSIVHMIPLSGTAVRHLVGRHGDPTAHLFLRSWIPSCVQLLLDQQPDAAGGPTPYWVVSTRRPERLIAALEAASARP